MNKRIKKKKFIKKYKEKIIDSGQEEKYAEELVRILYNFRSTLCKMHKESKVFKFNDLPRWGNYE